MNKKIFCFVLISCSYTMAFSQMLYHSALTSTGTSYATANITMRFATGQVANMHYVTAGTNFYEGLLQPLTVPMATSAEAQTYSLTLTVFPNPATDILYIIQPDVPVLHFNIYNINGGLVKCGIARGSIDIKSFEQGIYYLKLFNTTGETIYSFKFIKT